MALTTAQLGIMSDALKAIQGSMEINATTAPDPTWWDSVENTVAGVSDDERAATYQTLSSLYAKLSINESGTGENGEAVSDDFNSFFRKARHVALLQNWEVLKLDERYDGLSLSESSGQFDPSATWSDVGDSLKGAGDWIVIVVALVLAIVIFAKKKG
jgi:hypothetical protein